MRRRSARLNIRFGSDGDEEIPELDGHAAGRKPRRVRSRARRLSWRLAEDRKFVRRADTQAEQSRADLRRRQRARAAARGLCRVRACWMRLAPDRCSPRPRRTRWRQPRRRWTAARACCSSSRTTKATCMNFEMATRNVGRDRRPSSSTTTSRWRTRPIRPAGAGVAGTLVVEKIVGAAAEAGRIWRCWRRSATGSTPRRARWAWR